MNTYFGLPCPSFYSIITFRRQSGVEKRVENMYSWTRFSLCAAKEHLEIGIYDLKV